MYRCPWHTGQALEAGLDGDCFFARRPSAVRHAGQFTVVPDRLAVNWSPQFLHVGITASSGS